MKKISLIASVLVLSSSKALAVCPICTVAVGAGVGFSRWLGIDDVISGLWIGGLTVSMIAWTIDWLDRKNIHFRGRKISIALLYYLLLVPPLYWADIMGHPLNTLWGIDRLLLGILLGSGVFLLAVLGYDWLKKNNGNKSHFPFQKVAMPVASLLLVSLVFYFLI